MRIISTNWKRQLKITKNNTYNFPPYIQKIHRSPYHSYPALLPKLYLLLNLPKLKHHPPLHHHSLPLFQHKYLCQEPPSILHQMFSLNYKYWTPFRFILIAWHKWCIISTQSLSKKTAPLKSTLSFFHFWRLKTVIFLFLI